MKRGYHNLEKFRFQEVLLSKTNSTLKGNNELDAAASNIDGIFGQICAFLHLTE
jgi:hypothetical protein